MLLEKVDCYEYIFMLLFWDLMLIGINVKMLIFSD